MKKFISFMMLFTLLHAVLAQTPFFQHYPLLKKSETVQVNKIFQDRQGFIWLGTTKGLFRLDGRNIVRYTVSDSLPADHVTAIAQDSLGRIWTGHNNGKIAFMDNGHFTGFEPGEGNASAEISELLFDRAGNLWFGTLNDGLYYFTQDRLYRLDEQDGMPDLYIYHIVEDKAGNIWAGTDGGAVRCTLKDRKAVLKVVDYKDGLPDNIVRKLAVGENETIWMATEDAGIVHYDPSSGSVKPLQKDRWTHGTVSDFVLKKDQCWIACPQKGLLVYNFTTSQLKSYHGKDISGIASLKVLMNDQEGNIWAGTKTGLVRTPGDELEYISHADPAFDTDIIAVTADLNGNLWFSNSDGLFKRITNASGEVNFRKVLAKSAFEGYTVISLYTDPQGFIWAGLYGEGVLRIDPDNGNIRHLRNELRNGNVLSITGKDDHVWLATLGGGTSLDISASSLNVKNYSTADGLISDFIYHIYTDSRNRIWFATDGKGVDMMDAAGFHHYPQGLPSSVVYNIVEDGHRQIWANVQDNGLYVFNETTRHWQAPSWLSLRDNNIHAVSSDKGGNIVAMHDLGMDLIDLKKKKARYFGEEAGLRDKRANLNAVGRDVQGNVFFGTSEGIVTFSGSGDLLDVKPRARINDLRVFDKTADEKSLSHLAYDENNITIQFLGLWYKDPESVMFTYRLENYDRDWITTSGNAVTYSRLPPGEYIFHVKASETSNFEDAAEASISFVIQPPFWRTITFYILSAIFVITVAYIFIRYRERKLQYDKLILEAQVQRRTREIQRNNEEIQAQNEEITAQAEEIQGINENLELLVQQRTSELERKNKALEEYAFINAHKLRSPVASILGLINLMTKAKLDKDGEEINKRLQHSAGELDDVVRSITKAIEKADRKYPFPD